MKKFFGLVLIFCTMFIFIGCTIVNSKDDVEKKFLELLTESKSYKATGIMESFYNEGRKQNEFSVLYKNDDLVKVTLKNVDSLEEQIIMKNLEGVFILIPSINKSFKIKGGWPTNASYPYLLNSLAKDISNCDDIKSTMDDTTKTVEVTTELYKDSMATKEKIVFDKKTYLPKEVLIYDKKDNLYIRVVFNDINLNLDISDNEFVPLKTIETSRSFIESNQDKMNRKIKYPQYVPNDCKLDKELTEATSDGLEVVSIMTYKGDKSFTLIQQYVNDKETISYSIESGDIITILGNSSILKNNAIQTIYNGVEYTIASNTLEIEEMINVLKSFMIDDVEK